MKKNTLIKSLAAFTAVALSTGCIHETFPEGGGLTSQQLEATEGSLQYLLNAIPVSMVASGGVGYAGKYGIHSDFGAGALHLITEFMLEDMATPSNPGFNWFNTYAMNKSQSSEYIACSYFWDAYYQWIKGANNVIGLVDPNTASSFNLIMRGEALTYRASFYLDLARLFIPLKNTRVKIEEKIEGLTVPIVTEKTTEADSKHNPRASYQDMYRFILSDLNEAEKLLADQTPSVYKPSVNAIHGLMARAYLELGMLYAQYPVEKLAEGTTVEDYPAKCDSKTAYKEAARYARKVIDEGGYSVITQLQWEDPSNGFNNAESTRAWIWGLPLSSENAGNLLTFTAHASTEATWGYAPLTHVSVSKKLYHSISDDDFRKHSWLDPEFEKYYSYKFAGSAKDKENFLNGNPRLGIPPALSYQSLKFRPAQGEVTDNTVGGTADVLLMRIEEMYFIEMEAVLKGGDLAGAQKLLNEFMKYRYVPGAKKPYDCVQKTTTENSFIEEMMLQKRIEFWGEGILLYDYKRLDQGITRGYAGTNHSADMRLNCIGRSPQWNIVITRGEFQSNTAIGDDNNNPDPTDHIELWKN